MLNTHGYVSLGPYLCTTVVVPANNDFRRKKLPEIVATMIHCRSAPLRRSQQSTTLTRHRKWPIENRSCVGLWTITSINYNLDVSMNSGVFDLRPHWYEFLDRIFLIKNIKTTEYMNVWGYPSPLKRNLEVCVCFVCERDVSRQY